MEIGTVRLVDIEKEMQGAYLDYAMSVIVARALPDVRDGLKPVHRRILYAMYDMGLHASAPFKKSAVLLVTDGDADRCGIGDENGEFINQLRVYALLALYLLEVRGERGAIVRNPFHHRHVEQAGQDLRRTGT